ncbi:MAG: DNA repair protein RadA [Bdellovibrionales bacterium]|nr:DNA repair protein RadA [Bdellovibrionales bacterium]
MAKNKSFYVCQQCGSQRSRWEGRCNDCGAWNSLVEEQPLQISHRPTRSWTTSGGNTTTSEVVNLGQDMPETQLARCKTELFELDRVLGGGLVPGSFVLVGGDPGIGKSTLLLQMCGGLALKNKSTLYVSAEESVQQIGMRAKRLNIQSQWIQVTSESSLSKILQITANLKPEILIVDSIQTVYIDEVSSAPGSVAQVRECAAQLMTLAKGHNITVFIIGHVTKEGNLAGPRVLEHMVDTVLSFEGDGHNQYRLLRALKNRFGATNELGVFEMVSQGLKEVENPSAIFLEARSEERMGAAVFPAMEGSRPIMCEIQALTSTSYLAMPRRTSLGVDLNRVHMLCAVLDKYLNLELSREDIFVNVVGGLKLSEPCSDLTVAAALWSSKFFRPIPQGAVFIGEIGLTGEIRPTIFMEERIKECLKLGFHTLYLPIGHQKQLEKHEALKEIRVHWLKNITELGRVLGQGTQKPPSTHIAKQAQKKLPEKNDSSS